MLVVNLASSVAAEKNSGLLLRSAAFVKNKYEVFLPFSPGVVVATQEIEVVYSEPFELRGVVQMQGSEAGFGLKGLTDGDVLNVLRHTHDSLTAMVFHSPKRSAKIPCQAFCADGTTAQNCVECRSGAIIVRVCC